MEFQIELKLGSDGMVKLGEIKNSKLEFKIKQNTLGEKNSTRWIIFFSMKERH